jgi:hypothetical protein
VAAQQLSSLVDNDGSDEAEFLNAARKFCELFSLCSRALLGLSLMLASGSISKDMGRLSPTCRAGRKCICASVCEGRGIAFPLYKNQKIKRITERGRSARSFPHWFGKVGCSTDARMCGGLAL